jgi:hypothetical protein
MTSKLPSIQFYPGDWMKDPELRSVSLEARGLWIDLLCMMSESVPRGYLQINGKAPSETQIARMVGCSMEEISRGLCELSNAGVFSTTKAGVIFSRRMVKDNHLIDVRRKCGKMGGNPAFNRGKSNPYYNSIKDKQDKQTDKQTDNQKITPSSSSSSSIHIKRKTKTSIPDDFTISERVKVWAKGKGLNHLSDHLDNFILCSKAKGYQYADWDAAFMNAIRNNWAKIENGNGKGDIKKTRLPTQEEEMAEFNERWEKDNQEVAQ